METLIIILIVVMIAQTVLFIYNNIIDKAAQKQAVAFQEQVKNAQLDFTQEKEQMRKNYEAKDEIIKQWIDKCNKLDFELSEARKVNGLLKNRTAYIEGLQDSFNQQAEGEWESVAIFAEAEKKSQRRCYVEGMKAGVEWICGAVGVKAEFEIDDRFKEDKE
jgi:hypothetical protein